MLTNYLEKFNYFFHNIYINREVTTTETLNFLNLYVDYIMHIYGLDYSLYDIKIHATKTKSGAISSKADKYEKNVSCRTTALLSPDRKHANTYDIFLDRDLLKMKDYTDLPNLLYVACSCGHEAGHIYQYEKRGGKAQHSLDTERKIEKKLDESIEKKDKKLQRLMERYYTTFRTLSKMEREADKICYITLLDIFRILKENENDSPECDDHYIYFLSLCEDIVKDLKRKRNSDYTTSFRDYYKVKQELFDFNIKTSLP